MKKIWKTFWFIIGVSMIQFWFLDRIINTAFSILVAAMLSGFCMGIWLGYWIDKEEY